MFAYGFDQKRFQGDHKLAVTKLSNLNEERKTFCKTYMNLS